MWLSMPHFLAQRGAGTTGRASLEALVVELVSICP